VSDLWRMADDALENGNPHLAFELRRVARLEEREKWRELEELRRERFAARPAVRLGRIVVFPDGRIRRLGLGEYLLVKLGFRGYVR
jgi:hypothetical protein